MALARRMCVIEQGLFEETETGAWRPGFEQAIAQFVGRRSSQRIERRVQVVQLAERRAEKRKRGPGLELHPHARRQGSGVDNGKLGTWPAHQGTAINLRPLGIVSVVSPERIVASHVCQESGQLSRSLWRGGKPRCCAAVA